MPKAKTGSNPITDRFPGAALLLMGGTMAYFFLLKPYQEMVAGADQVEFGFKSAVIGPAIAIAGLIQLVLGARAKSWLGSDGEITWKGVLVTIVVLAFATGCWFWLDAQATALGYTESSRY
jgi:hypothetical protein